MAEKQFFMAENQVSCDEKWAILANKTGEIDFGKGSLCRKWRGFSRQYLARWPELRPFFDPHIVGKLRSRAFQRCAARIHARVLT